MHGWAVGDGGTILRTDDGGKVWQPSTIAVSSNFYAVAMAQDGQRGWVVGSEGTILQTSDSGVSWTLIPSGIKATFKAVAMTPDGRYGWVVGEDGAFLQTNDGGANWRPISSAPRLSFKAAALASDRQNGWVVTKQGTLFHTKDGGATWGQVAVKIFAQAIAMTSDGRRGWVVGSEGKVIGTEDGGITWNQLVSGTDKVLSAVTITPDGQHGWTVGLLGTIQSTSDGGANWGASAASDRAALQSVAISSDGRHGWAAGRGGALLVTQDGGITWAPIATGTGMWLSGIAMTSDGRYGEVIGMGGTVLRTDNGGATWVKRIEHSQAWFLAATMTASDQKVWVVGEGGTILYRDNGSATWKPATSDVKANLQSVLFTPDGQRGWVVGTGGTILRTDDYGSSWNSVDVAGDNSAFSAVAMTADGQQVWVAGKTGTILRSQNGGATWMSVDIGANVWLHAIKISSDGRYGWAAGTPGILLRSEDGGATWTRIVVETSALLTGLAMTPDGRRGLLVGDDGTILRSVDGGRNWLPIRYRRAMPPWVWLSWLAAAGLVGGGVYSWQRGRRELAFIADEASSDRPLAPGELDLMGFTSIAGQLTRYLCNINTIPPLTLAVTGSWGCGKSSLMNLVRGRLCAEGFYPVWFNAWHHQKEEHLLAALLEAVREQGVPPWWSLTGVSFRYRLFRHRLGRDQVSFALAAGIGLAAIGFAVAQPQHFAHLVSALGALTRGDMLNGLSQALSGLGRGELLAGGAVAAAVTTAAKLLGALRNGLTAAALDPGRLMMSLVGKTQVGALTDQLGFRYRFACEFEAVAQALRPRTMVIFVDDLDRCRPEALRELLEAINFLVSSGPCVVILGMDLDKVIRFVGHTFKDLPAAEIAQEKEGNNGADFAARFLEKLINIEIPVPNMDSAAGLALVSGKVALPAPSLMTWQAKGKKVWTATVWPQLRPLLWAAAALMVLDGSYRIGAQLDRSTSAGLIQFSSIAPSSLPVEAAQLPSSSPRGGRQFQADQSGPPTFVPGQTDAPSLQAAIGLFIGLVLLGALGLWWRSREEPLEIKDSMAFEDARRLWAPVVLAQATTPRAVKRFVNRVRFYAMYPDETRPSSWEAMLFALEAFNCLRKSGAVITATTFAELAAELDSEIVKEVLAKHLARFPGSWPPDEATLTRYRSLAAGVRIR
jgi:photosystem II stability/assembly factor-like uncharacterized protein